MIPAMAVVLCDTYVKASPGAVLYRSQQQAVFLSKNCDLCRISRLCKGRLAFWCHGIKTASQTIPKSVPFLLVQH